MTKWEILLIPAIALTIVTVLAITFRAFDPGLYSRYETLVTENVDEARLFQRECWKKNEATVRVTFLVEAWELQCSWVENEDAND